MEHFKDNSGCSGPKKSEIFWNNSRKVQYVFAGAELTKYTVVPNSASENVPIDFFTENNQDYRNLYLIIKDIVD